MVDMMILSQSRDVTATISCQAALNLTAHIKISFGRKIMIT